ncbi:MAG: FHA domain-containing protein [Chloroflexota bacterium]|nr:FHA domain-containing protein [Chloroflexota bacterium]
MLKCEKCGFKNPDGLERCHTCGTSLLEFAQTMQDAEIDLHGATIVDMEVPQVKRPPARLELKSGRFSGRVYPLRENQTFGREKCEIILRDRHLSRQHAAIKFVEGDYLLIDLGSANHTFVNDQIVQQPTVLKDGDVISAGDIDLEFKLKKETA